MRLVRGGWKIETVVKGRNGTPNINVNLKKKTRTSIQVLQTQPVNTPEGSMA